MVVKVPESIRDTNTGKTWDIESDGSGKVTLTVASVSVSSVNPLPVNIGTSAIEVNVDVNDIVTVAPLRNSVLNTVLEVPIGTTAVPPTPLTDRKSLSIKNVTSTTAYIGGINVSSANGYPLTEGESYDADVSGTVVMYAVSQSGTSTLRILEFN